MKTKHLMIVLMCSIITILFAGCTSNPLALTSDENVINENNKKSEVKNKNNNILTNYYKYYENGCLIKCWDYDGWNPVWTYWAAWVFKHTDDWGGKNYQCSQLGGECQEWSWRAVYCGIINPQNNPTPEYTNNVTYIQTLMAQAGQSFIGELNQWSYEEIYVQPHYQFPPGTSQINIDFINSIDYQ